MTNTPHFFGPAACRRLSMLVFMIAMTAITATAFAHPGHGVTPAGDSAAHYLLEPTHGLGVVAIFIVALASAVIVRARGLTRRFTQQ